MCYNACLFVSVISSGKTPDLLCPELRDPQWGAVAINFNSEGNTYEAVYSCEAGRSLNGGRRRYCISNSRRWSGEEPTCIPGKWSYTGVDNVVTFCLMSQTRCWIYTSMG